MRATIMHTSSERITEAIEIQGEKPQKSEHPPPLQPGANWLIFWRETLHVNTVGLTEAIFEFHPKSRDITQKSKNFEPRHDLNTKMRTRPLPPKTNCLEDELGDLCSRVAFHFDKV